VVVDDQEVSRCKKEPGFTWVYPIIQYGYGCQTWRQERSCKCIENIILNVIKHDPHDTVYRIVLSSSYKSHMKIVVVTSSNAIS
jgi:hypothetical protein